GGPNGRGDRRARGRRTSGGGARARQPHRRNRDPSHAASVLHDRSRSQYRVAAELCGRRCKGLRENGAEPHARRASRGAVAAAEGAAPAGNEPARRVRGRRRPRRQRQARGIRRRRRLDRDLVRSSGACGIMISEDDKLDEALEETFPASDAPANTVETGIRTGAPLTAAVIDNRAANRFELTIDGHTAFLAYERTHDALTLVH